LGGQIGTIPIIFKKINEFSKCIFRKNWFSSGKENSILKDRLLDFGDGELTFFPSIVFFRPDNNPLF